MTNWGLQTPPTSRKFASNRFESNPSSVSPHVFIPRAHLIMGKRHLLTGKSRQVLNFGYNDQKIAKYRVHIIWMFCGTLHDFERRFSSLPPSARSLINVQQLIWWIEPPLSLKTHDSISRFILFTIQLSTHTVFATDGSKLNDQNRKFIKGRLKFISQLKDATAHELHHDWFPESMNSLSFLAIY